MRSTANCFFLVGQGIQNVFDGHIGLGGAVAGDGVDGVVVVVVGGVGVGADCWES